MEEFMRNIRKHVTMALCMALLLLVATACGNEGKINDWIQQGDSAYASGNYEEALQLYSQILELDAEKDEIYNNRGMAYLNLKQYDQALADFSRAIELEGGTDVYYNNRGLVYYYQEQNEEALADFTKALEMNRSDANYYANRGDVYNAMEDYDHALEDYNEALRIDDTRTATLNNRASVYFKQGKYEEAAADYTAAIGEKAENGILYWNRGEAYRMLGKFQEAVEDYNQYAQDPKAELTEEFLTKRAEAYAELEEYDLAAADYTAAIEKNSENPALYQGRANVNYQQGAYEEALEDYNQYLSSEEDAVALGNRGYCYLQLEQLEEALADLNRCIQLKPEYAWAYYTRGQIYQKQEKYEEAKADYDKANQLVSE